MLNPEDRPRGFILAPAITEGLKKGWDLRVRGMSLVFDNLRTLHADSNYCSYETRTKINDAWVILRARFNSLSPVVHFAAWSVYGGLSTSAPILQREDLSIGSPHPAGVTITTLDIPGGPILNGQGTNVRAFSYDFKNEAWDTDEPHPPLSYSRFAPTSPNQTGGNWPYMGINVSLDDDLAKARRELYAIGCYGGYFTKKDGSWLEEADRPMLVAREHIHVHSKDPGWIEYTDPSAPWRDRMAGGFKNQDEQHLCLFSPLAEAARQWPEDEGFKMLLEAAGHVYTRQVPVIDKGTTHDHSGAERAMGRILKTGVDLAETSARHGPMLTARAIDRFDIDQRAYAERLELTGEQWREFGHNPGFSPSEIGIHYWGVLKLHPYHHNKAALEKLMREMERYCFDSFINWDSIQGSRGWAVPYWRHRTGEPWGGPSSTGHFCWLAAISHEPQNEVEREKRKHIYALGESIPARFKS